MSVGGLRDGPATRAPVPTPGAKSLELLHARLLPIGDTCITMPHKFFDELSICDSSMLSSDLFVWSVMSYGLGDAVV
jgi:hypothetical protein